MRGKMTRVEELRWGIEALVNGDAGDKVRRIVKQLIAAAREEGAEQEKAVLLSSALTSWCGKSDEYGDMLMMPASVLAPKEEK